MPGRPGMPYFFGKDPFCRSSCHGFKPRLQDAACTTECSRYGRHAGAKVKVNTRGPGRQCTLLSLAVLWSIAFHEPARVFVACMPVTVSMVYSRIGAKCLYGSSNCPAFNLLSSQRTMDARRSCYLLYVDTSPKPHGVSNGQAARCIWLDSGCSGISLRQPVQQRSFFFRA